jgi:hypothetical protein
MFSIKQLLFTVFVLPTTVAFGQIPKYLFNEVTEESYNPKDFTSKKKSLKERVGIYQFGESEGEWEFVLLQNKDSFIVQIFNGNWGQDLISKQEAWLSNCKTFNNVSIQGNKIFFGNYSGLFAEEKFKGKISKALLLFCNPIEGRNYGKDSAQVGSFNYQSSIENFYQRDTTNDYHKLSIQILDDAYFKSKTKSDLKIMRNTIYARYGLVFQKGGEMETYFRKKDWYKPHLKDVSTCLTTIEIQNLRTITKLEQQ